MGTQGRALRLVVEHMTLVLKTCANAGHRWLRLGHRSTRLYRAAERMTMVIVTPPLLPARRHCCLIEHHHATHAHQCCHREHMEIKAGVVVAVAHTGAAAAAAADRRRRRGIKALPLTVRMIAGNEHRHTATETNLPSASTVAIGRTI